MIGELYGAVTELEGGMVRRDTTIQAEDNITLRRSADPHKLSIDLMLALQVSVEVEELDGARHSYSTLMT